MISVGDRLPDATFKTMTADGAVVVTTAEVFAGKKVVLFGVPGAFTPTCSNNHLPGYLENHDAILARGVDTIAVVSVNDVHVMGAWARFTGGEGKILFLADGSGDFAKAVGLDADFSAGGMVISEALSSARNGRFWPIPPGIFRLNQRSAARGQGLGPHGSGSQA